MASDRTPLLGTSPQEEQRIQSYVTATTTTQTTDDNGDIQKTVDEEEVVVQHSRRGWRSWRSDSYLRSIVMLVVIFVIFTGLEIALLKLNLPAVGPEDEDALKFPKNLKELRRLNEILSKYIDNHFVNVYVTYFATYVYLQSFSVPGSMWLSILGGALFNFWLTLFTVSICSAIGSTVAYLISASLGSVAVVRLIGDRIAKWNEQLVNHKQHMLNYMIVLRIAPLPPNWTINLGAPHLEVPLGAFFWGTFIGVAPPSFIHVQAGAALDRLSSSDELQLVTPTNVACLVAVAIVALIPVFVRRHYKL
ncbi:snare associated Golgi protein-domain-containing protein [Zychaea mexicana]|uniref:snare associated Golgi protein-domain-containing protein n=1 Tax=Zychaea mexicana TaxID=64656 RepID=UPI0022FE0A7F|nr:snare associated Golgi protein-domain-containing protein [Zychaea mexicana]KAI9490820.1 snare associated Golgi protein-domain-containing protein [Zychaea mexicana]